MDTEWPEIIDQLAYPEGVTAAEILADLMQLPPDVIEST